VFGSEAKLAGKGCQTYALWVGNPFSFFVCQETKISPFYRCCFWPRSLVPNGWRYEKLPIAGDFLSRYTKVEAGYKP